MRATLVDQEAGDGWLYMQAGKASANADRGGGREQNDGRQPATGVGQGLAGATAAWKGGPWFGAMQRKRFLLRRAYAGARHPVLMETDDSSPSS